MTRLYPILLTVLLFSCHSAKVIDAPKPAESYTMNEPEPVVSTLSIPVQINLDQISTDLNIALSKKALYEDFSYDDNSSDGFMMSAWKSKDVTLFASGNTLKYRVPVSIWLKKKLFVGEAEGNGELALGFKTTYSVNPDWTITTKTEVEYHEWLQTPVLKTGLGNISIETLANFALNRSKQTLTQSLDRYINQQLSLKPYVEEVWTSVQAPVLISEAYKMWMKTTPLKIGMTPVSTLGNVMLVNLMVECYNDVSFGEKPIFRENTLVPDLAYVPQVNDGFQMQFATDIPFTEAERLAKSMMLGQEFASGKNKVKIDDLKLWGNNERLIVLTQLSGTFNGKIYFLGRPAFNAAKNSVEITDLDFHFDTKNTLHKTAAWIFQGSIRKQMQKAMTFPLDENLIAMKQSVQETLNRYEVSPGVILSGALDSVKVVDTRLNKQGIRVDIAAKGKVKINYY